MKNNFKTLLTLVLFFQSIMVMADTWRDPKWRDMIEGSDLIALVEFTSNGDYKAKANIIKVYHGEVKNREIWISNFSNRYGPIDTKKIGEKFIVFLKRNSPTEKGIAYLEEQALKNPDTNEYFEDYKAGKMYYVWTPTSGDLKVKRNQVQYDLLQTSFYQKQEYFSLNEFEFFLKSTQILDKHFHKQIIEKLINKPRDSKTTQYIMMLYLTGFKEYNSIFNYIAKKGNIQSCFALAQLLGQINNNASRDILVGLLEHENSIVLGEAVRQLATENPDFIGPILLEKLRRVANDDIYAQNVMYPVFYAVDGGKIEIIKTLGKLDYKAAIPDLLPLLETDDENVFFSIIRVLNKMENKDYVPYINKYLESGKRDFVFDICALIIDYKLTDCLPSLMHFVANHDKTVHPSMEYTISRYSGMSYFQTDSVKSFLFSDFLNVLKMETVSMNDGKMDWIEAYIDIFTEFKNEDAKPFLYDFMYDYHGISREFLKDTSLFKEKNIKEDSIMSVFREKLKDYDIKEINCLALIEKKDAIVKLKDYSVRLTFNQKYDSNKLFKSIEAKGLNKNKALLTFGASSYTYGARKIRRFNDNLMRKFLNYLASFPNEIDIAFMENLKKYDYAKTEKDIIMLDSFITKAREKLLEK